MAEDFKVEWKEPSIRQYEKLMASDKKLTKEQHDFAYQMYKLEQYITYGEI